MSDASWDWSTWKPAPVLPKNAGPDGGLGFTIAVLCFLACLTVLMALAADRAVTSWGRDLSAGVTIQVRPKGEETGGEAAARAAEALAAVPGVSEARSLDRAEAERLLEPWLGKGGLPEDLPLPRLVAVDLDPKAPATPAALNAALAQAGVDASLDDHGQWIKDVQRAGLAARLASLAACLLTGAAAASVIGFATRAGLAAGRDVVEVLHLTGARDTFIAALFQRRFASLAFMAGAWGAVFAAAGGAAFKFFGGNQGFSPALPLAWTDLAAVLPCPVMAALVAALSARRTAMAILGDSP